MSALAVELRKADDSKAKKYHYCMETVARMYTDDEACLIAATSLTEELVEKEGTRVALAWYKKKYVRDNIWNLVDLPDIMTNDPQNLQEILQKNPQGRQTTEPDNQTAGPSRPAYNFPTKSIRGERNQSQPCNIIEIAKLENIQNIYKIELLKNIV